MKAIFLFILSLPIFSNELPQMYSRAYVSVCGNAFVTQPSPITGMSLTIDFSRNHNSNDSYLFIVSQKYLDKYDHAELLERYNNERELLVCLEGTFIRSKSSLDLLMDARSKVKIVNIVSNVSIEYLNEHSKLRIREISQ